ncbi:branched-chain amino acid ABC transporter permease [soil metagenome]
MQQFVNGIFLGSIYGLFAMGYTLVFGVLDLLNLAHSAVFMLGAFVGLQLAVGLGWPLWAAVLGAIAAGAVMGVLVERIAFAPLRNRADSHFAGLISSIALAIILGAVALGFFGPNTRRFPQGTFPEGRIVFAGASMSILQAVILLISFGLMLGLNWVVRRSRLGTAMRAVAENPKAARLLGVDVERVTIATFAISSALGAAAGVLFALAFNTIRPEMGLGIELKGLAVIIVGGMGSIPGALVGGLMLGLFEVFAVSQIGSSWRDAVAFGLLFAVLLLRPQGLLGHKRVREV